MPCILIVLLDAGIGQVGQTGLAFLKLDRGGHSDGRSVFRDCDGSVGHVLYNPASLGLASSPQLLLMHKEWIQDTKTEYIGATNHHRKGGAGISINSTSINNMRFVRSGSCPGNV